MVLRQLFVALALWLGLCVFGFAGMPPGDPQGERLLAIQREIRTEHKISAADRAFVAKMLDSPTYVVPETALSDLGLEMGYGLCSVQDAKALVLASLQSGRGSGAGSEFEAILGFLGFDTRMTTPDPLNRKLRAVGRADEESLGPRTRAVLTSALGSALPRDRLTAAVALVGYRGLPRSTRAWGLHLIDGQLAKSRGNEKQAWRIARRAFVARNP